MHGQKPAEKRRMIDTVQVQEDPQTGDLFIELPPEVVEKLAWAEGDTLIWEGNGTTCYVRKKDDTSSMG